MCNDSPERPSSRRETTRDRILDAAERRVGGGGSLNLSRVAVDAGVSRGTVYRWFGGGEGLAEALAGERGLAGPCGSTRERILDAVGARLAERGLHGVTFEAVARHAGTGQTTVYRLFGDHIGLMTAFVAERTPKRLVPTLSLARNDGDLVGDLVDVARELLVFMRDHRHLLPLLFDPDPRTAALFEDIRASTGSTRAALASYFQRQVRAGRLGGEPRMLADTFTGMIFGLGLGDPDRSAEDLDALARFAVRTLLDGHAVGGTRCQS
jgi:AcrR family transcriptional regulator